MQPTEFLQSVKTLYQQIEHWGASKGLQFTRENIQLNEEAYEPYTAEKLSVLDTEGKTIAEFIPKGASIIGAKGRIDLVGNVDSVILVDWDQGGPHFTTTIDDGINKDTQTVPVYRSVDEAGWYWVESRKLARAHRFDACLFFDLLPSVSEHDQTSSWPST